MPFTSESKIKQVVVHLEPLANKRLEEYCKKFNFSKSAGINVIITNYITLLKKEGYKNADKPK